MMNDPVVGNVGRRGRRRGVDGIDDGIDDGIRRGYKKRVCVQTTTTTITTATIAQQTFIKGTKSKTAGTATMPETSSIFQYCDAPGPCAPGAHAIDNLSS